MIQEQALLQFPCRFPIKIMGLHTVEFLGLVLEQVRRHAPDLDESLIQVRHSRAGRYQSITVVIEAHSRVQLDAIYRDLSAHPQIRLVL